MNNAYYKQVMDLFIQIIILPRTHPEVLSRGVFRKKFNIPLTSGWDSNLDQLKNLLVQVVLVLVLDAIYLKD